MYVVVAQGTHGETSVYGSFSRQVLAEEWAQAHMTSGIELTIFPVLDPRDARRRGQLASEVTFEFRCDPPRMFVEGRCTECGRAIYEHPDEDGNLPERPEPE